MKSIQLLAFDFARAAAQAAPGAGACRARRSPAPPVLRPAAARSAGRIGSFAR